MLSLQIHEGGKRHKDNVAKKISELRKKGKKEFKAQKKFEDDMQKMEEAAMAAAKKDMMNNPDLARSYSLDALGDIIPAPKKKSPPPQVEKSQPTNSKKVMIEKETKMARKCELTLEDASGDSAAQITDFTGHWYEAVSSEGYTYYWNDITHDQQTKDGSQVRVAKNTTNDEGTTMEQPREGANEGRLKAAELQSFAPQFTSGAPSIKFREKKMRPGSILEQFKKRKLEEEHRKTFRRKVEDEENDELP
ncbi:unnamed protein product [Darwinula stevensoni]|uniref:WW domain-binding protein 4 n=1 Tax=Darwinula stevensoni TaxID=69355 RepID=A0A7R8ZZT5_9CRUS|nr:unnamed protein product [Darwinula stevensoni]CAG0883192.1 unnamed protein product [Darwinula stevensoni]